MAFVFTLGGLDFEAPFPWVWAGILGAVPAQGSVHKRWAARPAGASREPSFPLSSSEGLGALAAPP